MTRSRSRAWFKPVVAFAIAVAITTGAWVGLSADVFFATQLRFSDTLFPGAVADDGSSSSRSTRRASLGARSDGRGPGASTPSSSTS